MNLDSRISISWWNTSLAPLGASRATLEQKAIAAAIVKYLANELSVDCMALGEVTAQDLEYLSTELGLPYYETYDGTLKQGRLLFDTGVLFNSTKLTLVNSEHITARRGTKSLKLANRLDFVSSMSEKPLFVFVSHWPSRLWCHEQGVDRDFLGVRLRDEVESINALAGGPANIILLGDYNDEPHDRSLEGQLLAVRDRRLVRRRPDLMYNPFWRHLGEAMPHIPGQPCRSFSGSYSVRSSQESGWRTFDQIIFSSSFLGASEWQLNEEYSQILSFPPFDLPVLSKEIFDHFPVLSVIERKEPHG